MFHLKPGIDFQEIKFTRGVIDQELNCTCRLTLRPIPPPPAVALRITGYPILLHAEINWAESEIKLVPGTTGTSACIASSLAICFRPNFSTESELGPAKRILFLASSAAKLEFSDRNPYPGTTTSIFWSTASFTISSMFV
ncbi:hypothetical protein OGAPHI_004531 [Ogataea philodendri]|uniref:Uncharacterized protein n=1 Tax=Ogataea philodendri TaxID=1378263 RepID=A0A9P8P7N5_9ASCO|nr:uncharacterized protein OGAPHI_004531 [Ogataea philodendri]KAH3666342.1 hypothetical protein OGAPHI_004531 [Ogataea philodendri]